MTTPAGLVTLTTDFGDGSSYVAAMKGAILAVNSAVHIIDLCHNIPPQDLTATAYFLAETVPFYPPRSIHAVVVDPAVGTERALLCIRWNEQWLLAPDNGCWTSLERHSAAREIEVYRLSESKYWAPAVSFTFHGRDILAPVAGHLSLGVAPDQLGRRVQEWVRLRLPEPERTSREVRGEVIRVDRFGNLITNITRGAIGDYHSVHVGGRNIPRWVQTYGDAEPGAVVALIGSCDLLEIAVVQGSAAERLGLGAGACVTVGQLEDS